MKHSTKDSIGPMLIQIVFAVIGLSLIFFLFYIVTTVKMPEDYMTASERRSMEEKKYVQMCLDRGGVPIFSYWDKRLVDCKGITK